MLRPLPSPAGQPEIVKKFTMYCETFHKPPILHEVPDMVSLLPVTAITVAALLVCALQAIRARRLLVSAMWLAGASAATALLMYALGAAEVAVIELSVGAGLVTVLFVFAINIAGDEPIPVTSRVPRPLAWLVTLGSLALLGWLTLPAAGGLLPLAGAQRFATALWEQRSADVLLQVALIFTGVLGVIGLLAEDPAVGARHVAPLHGVDEKEESV
jgi:uncharacterized MnhB-related membrane protein